MTDNNNENFAQSIQVLENLVQQMETGDLSLEQALTAFEQGVKLTQKCQKILTQAEQKVQILSEQNNQIQAQAFKVSEDN